MPSWEIDYQGFTVIKLLEFLPTVLSVVFICVLSMLVTFENLYIWFSQEFDAREEIKKHSVLLGVTAIFGGFISLLGLQRIILNKKIGATQWGGIITFCMAFLAFEYIDVVLKFIPSCVIGGFLLYEGVEVLQKSFSNRKNLAKIDLFLACLIVFLVAFHSFVYGFIIGLILSFLYSVYSLSQIQLINKKGNLADLRSLNIRPHGHDLIIKRESKKFKYFHLEGYLFYGTVMQLDLSLSELDFNNTDGIVLDLLNLSGLDTSAKISLGRILTKHRSATLKWYVIASPQFTKLIQGVLPADENIKNSIFFYDTVDLVIEDIETQILTMNNISITSDALQFLSNQNLQSKFITYCKKISLAKGESITCKTMSPQELFFIYDGECTLEVFEITGKRALSRVFTGAFIGGASHYSQDGLEVEIVAQKDSMILELSDESILRMRIEDSALYNYLNEYLIKVLSHSLSHANTFN